MRSTRIVSLLSFLFLFCFSPVDTTAQEEWYPKSYVIQIATFSNWAEFVKEKDRFNYAVTFQAQEVGNRIKVYLLDYNGEHEEGMYFNEGETLDVRYAEAKKDYPGAFRRSDVDISDLTPAWDIFEKYKEKEVPTEYTAKGGTTEIASTDSGNYKIQLGAFTEKKSNDYIAERYGLTKSEKAKADALLSHDFTTIKKKVCRRYYFGEYQNKKDAVAKKKALEKETNRKLILVKN